MISALCISVLLTSAPTDRSKPTPPSVVETADWASYRWTEGARTKVLWDDPFTVVQRKPNDAFEKMLLALDPKAQRVRVSKALTVWLLSKHRSSIARTLSSAFGQAMVTSLFRDQPTPHGRARIANGEVVVQLSPGIDAAAWSKKNLLTVEQRGRHLVLQTAGGVDCISLAERVAHLEGVTLAVPNWSYVPNRR